MNKELIHDEIEGTVEMHYHFEFIFKNSLYNQHSIISLYFVSAMLNQKADKTIFNCNEVN